MFGSLENKRKRREKREKKTLTEAAGDIYIKRKLCQKIASLFFLLQIGGGGGLISVGINYTKMIGQEILLCRENFASLAKLHRDSEITKFRYVLQISLASKISLA